AKSKHDKNLVGLLSQIEADKIALYSFYNAQTYDLTVIPQPIIDIDFASVRQTDAQFNATMVLNVDGTVEEGIYVKIVYSIDGNEETRHIPMMALQPGSNVLTLYFPLGGLTENRLYRFKVVAQL